MNFTDTRTHAYVCVRMRVRLKVKTIRELRIPIVQSSVVPPRCTNDGCRKTCLFRIHAQMSGVYVKQIQKPQPNDFHIFVAYYSMVKPFWSILRRFPVLFLLLSITFKYVRLNVFNPQVGSNSPFCSIASHFFEFPRTVLTRTSFLICPVQEFRGRSAVFFPPIITLYNYITRLIFRAPLGVYSTVLQHTLL